MDDIIKQSQLATLNFDKQVEVAASILGYRSLPPTIDQFITDQYYLGDICKNLFPFWVNKLKDLFPTCISNAYPIVVFTGAIGCGKSTMSKIMAMYLMCRLLHLRNPYDTFSFMPGKNLTFSFFTYKAGLAQTDFLNVINEWIDQSPYFNNEKSLGKLDFINLVADGTRSNSQIGSDVIFYNLSELNFVNPDKANEKLDQASKRFQSRFGMLSKFFGQIILDTSSQGDDSVVDKFVNESDHKNIYTVYCNHWIVKEHFNYYFRAGKFQVYKGDSAHHPFIISEDNPLTDDMDKERVIDVPVELKVDFEENIITALQDLAGVSTNATNKFFSDTSRLLKCFNLPNYVGEDVVKFDFYEKSDKLIYKFDQAIKSIPNDRIIYIRYDIGTVSDLTGLAIAYFDKWNYYDGDKKIKRPEIVIPLACGISRYDGQATPIYHLYEFILDLKEKFEIGEVTLDQYGSLQLIQDLKREKIKARVLSVDKTDQAYKTTKQLANFGLLRISNNKLLKIELCELKQVGFNKVDHPQFGSKDIADAVAGVIQSIYDKMDDPANTMSTKYKISAHSDILKNRNLLDGNIFNDMIRGLY